MLEILASRSGQPTARLRGLYLHSPYDPGAEALRFVQDRLKGQHPAVVLLLGAELGHAREALRRLHPQAALLAVFYDAQLHERSLDRPGPNESWRPGQGSLLEFLRGAVDELDAEGLVVLEWPASARLFPEASLEAHRQVAQLLRERRGSLATTAALGRRWLANSFRNFLGLQRILAPRPALARRPILIAASGPTLERGLEAIGGLRDRMALWCLPSALACVLERGLAPDLVVATDPGYYAAAHLQALARVPAPLAMPLSAAPGAWAYPGGTLLLGQDSPYEEALLDSAGYPALRIPPQGSVAATALMLALWSTRGPVILAGLDLCFLDLHGHARPGIFELLRLSSSQRTSPCDHQAFLAAMEQAPRRLSAGPGPARSGLALETYAGWFASLPARQSERLYRLNPSPIGLPSLRNLNAAELRELANSANAAERSDREALPPWPNYPNRSTRLAQALRLLGGWRRACHEVLPGACRRSGSLKFLQDACLASLAYAFDAASTAEIRRLRRLRGDREAAGRAAELLERLSGFLALLERRLEEAAG